MIFDGHSDIFSDVRYKREAGETQVLKNHHLDRLRKGGIGGACFVIWADTYNGHAPKDEMEAIVKGIKGEMAETKEFVLIHNVEELKAAEAAGKFAILLGIEGLAGIGEDLSKIDELYDLGARHAMLMCLLFRYVITIPRNNIYCNMQFIEKKYNFIMLDSKMQTRYTDSTNKIA